jgi:hypothetical protein
MKQSGGECHASNNAQVPNDGVIVRNGLSQLAALDLLHGKFNLAGTYDWINAGVNDKQMNG